MADTPSGIEADPNRRIKELETKIRDLETRLEVLERFMGDRYP